MKYLTKISVWTEVNALNCFKLSSIHANDTSSDNGQSRSSAITYLPIHQSKTSNINTTYKTYSANLNWTPVLSGGSWEPGSGVAGMTQKFTSHGYASSWTFH